MRLNIFRIFKRVAAILDGTFALNQSLIHQAVKILILLKITVFLSIMPLIMNMKEKMSAMKILNQVFIPTAAIIFHVISALFILHFTAVLIWVIEEAEWL